MIEPPLHPDEPLRLQAVRSMNVLDTPIDERFERITRLASHMLNMPIAAISLIDADRQWFKSIQGSSREHTPREVSFCGHVIHQNGVMVVRDARIDPRFHDNPLVTGDPRVVFYAGHTLHSLDGLPIGALCVVDHEPREFTPEQAQMLRDLAELAETELATATKRTVEKELIEQLSAEKRRTLIDTLTRLWNRDGIMDVLIKQIADAGRSGDHWAVMIGDLDHFKTINDTQGHAAGDAVLEQTGRRLIGAVRSIDSVGRTGGEEFLFVLGTIQEPGDAEKVAERVRSAMEANAMRYNDDRIPVTMSLGVVVVRGRPAGVRVSDILKHADDALYRAKEAGRNRVCVSQADLTRRAAA